MLRKAPIKKQMKVEEFNNNSNNNNKIKEGQVLNFDCSYWQKFQGKKAQSTGTLAFVLFLLTTSFCGP